jgi:competence protein ComEA
MKNFWFKFFHLSISEWRGIFLLAILIFFISLLPYTLKNHYKPTALNFDDLDSISILLQNNRILALASRDSLFQTNYKTWGVNSINPFPFDPNTISANDFKKLGFTDKQTQTFINYRSKGATFKTKNDLLKLYFVDDDIFAVLAPYILLSDTITYSNVKTTKKTDKAKVQIELNAADSIDLIKIPGIGKYRAKKILELKNKLGGFIDYDQLKMIYGFNDSLIETLKPYLTINPYLIKKININNANIKEMAKHPYIGYNLAISIYNYKQNHGNYKSIEELKNLKSVNDSIYHLVLPYITVQ